METKEQRRKSVGRALGINALGGVEPSKDFMGLLERYIEEEMSLEQIRKMIIDKYKEKPELKYPEEKEIIDPKEFIIN